MSDIIGSVISIVTDNPIFALAVIFIVLSNLLKSGKSSDDASYDEYERQYDDSYDSDNSYQDDTYGKISHDSRATGSMTWEDMEQAYGIKIARKEEPSSMEERIQTSVEEIPKTTVEEVSPIVVASKTESTEQIDSVKKRDLSLEECLSQYNAESTAILQALEIEKEQEVLAYGTETFDEKESNGKGEKSKLVLSAKEGMKWAIILDKPKALRAKYR